MSRIKSLVKGVGVFLILFAFLVNPILLGKLFFADKKIDEPSIIIQIVVFEIVILLIGLYLLLKSTYDGKYIKEKYTAYFFSITAALFLFGGLVVLLFVDKNSFFSSQSIPSIILILIFGIVSFFCAKSIFKKYKKIFIFNNIFFFIILIGTLYLCNFAASFFTPPWPAIGLHGVDPELGQESWGRIIHLDGGVGFNSFGQRDKEREKNPSLGIYRIAFLGDSILEESSTKPISSVTEERLNNSSIEIINLGVSATAPDEYYYRMKNIGLALGVNRCFLFFYCGNDFIQKRTLFSFLGVLAVYPRESLFSKLGLESINHILINDFRPILRAWGKAGEFNKKEQDLWGNILHSNDDEVEAILLTMVNRIDKGKLNSILKKRDMSSFYEMLRNPDNNLFRSYYLSEGLTHAISKGQEYQSPVSELFAYEWIKRTYELCSENNIDFTLVIVPEAFQVDKRMQDLWSPLTDMKKIADNKKQASDRLILLAQRDGIEYIDLHSSLEDHRGTYLNPDGHLSEYGIEIVSEVIADQTKK